MSYHILAGSAARTMVLALGLGALGSGAVFAENDAERQNLAQCAKDICSIIVSKSASGPDLSCDLTKTWDKEDIQKSADEKRLSWGLGSAKCSVKVSAKRADVVAALSAPEGTYKMDKHTISCEIGSGDEKYSVSASMAPEIKFKDGKAAGVSLHMGDIQGTTLIKGVVWTAAKLEQNFGILEGDMVREVNRFVQKECPKIVSGEK